MEAHDRRHVLLPLPVPREHGRTGRRRLSALLLAALLAGCTAPPPEEEAPLEPAGSVEGTIAIGDAFTLRDARLSVAPGDAAPLGTQGRPVALADPPWTARTSMQQDHWVLEATLRERTPGSGAGLHRIRLDWNGDAVGAVHVRGPNSTAALSVVVRFDVGPELARSNVYAFEITRVS